MITNKELVDVILAYRAGKITKALFRECFVKLAEWVFQSRNYYFDTNDPQKVIGSAADLCVEKFERFDEQRGRAFSFFVSIIGCFIRQEHRVHMNTRRLK